MRPSLETQAVIRLKLHVEAELHHVAVFSSARASFYGQFLKYTGGDKNALDTVLTPRHVTDLFCDLGDLDLGRGDKVISAMGHLSERTEDPAERQTHNTRSQSLARDSPQSQ